ncbi:MAG: LPS-assembly protein LptD [Neisseriaceae bacterium]|nr:LPS-assembly protein LptD [Neisseriaceae bacterium]
MPLFRLSPLMAALSLIIPCYVMGEQSIYATAIGSPDTETAISQVNDLLLSTASVSPKLDGDISKKYISKTPEITASPVSEIPFYTVPENMTILDADSLQGINSKESHAKGHAVLRRLNQTLSADLMDYYAETQKAYAQGNVVLVREDQIFQSDWMEYDLTGEERLRAGDAFEMTKPGVNLVAHDLEYFINKQTGAAQDANFVLNSNTGILRGHSNSIEMQGANYYRLNKVKANTCEEDDGSWYLNASSIDADYSNNVGVAKNAYFTFYDVPVFYTPWMDFPLTGSRKTGFLFPTFGVGSDGLDLTIPFFWNLAPNYDITITPRYIGHKGLMLGAEMRYLSLNSKTELYTEQMPRDKETETSRYLWTVNHTQSLTGGWSIGIDATGVSDSNYFEDFGSRSSSATNVNLAKEIWVTKTFDWLNLFVNAKKYQTLSNESSPYSLLPSVLASGNKKLAPNLSLNLRSSYTLFDHSTLQTGDRVVAYPSLNLTGLDTSWGYIKPKLGIHMSYYNLSSGQNPIAPNGQGNKTTESRVLPIFSTDTGLYLEKESQIFSVPYKQTLEPRLYYLYIPPKDQSNLPNFDTSVNDVNWAQLFNENMYSGEDRVNAANQVTAALSSRFIDGKTGQDRLKIGVAQLYHFNKEELNLSGALVQKTTALGDTIFNASGDIFTGWRLNADYHYSSEIADTKEYSFALRYNPQAGKTLGIRYSYDKTADFGYGGLIGPQKQIDLAGQWPITRNLYGVFRYNHSILDNVSLEQMGGLTYNDGCWGISLVAQRYITNIDEYKVKYLAQFELRDLSSLGNTLNDVLNVSIPGYFPAVYQKDEEK